MQENHNFTTRLISLRLLETVIFHFCFGTLFILCIGLCSDLCVCSVALFTLTNCSAFSHNTINKIWILFHVLSSQR